MAKFFKEVGASVSATLQATTAVTQAVANTVTTIANSASSTVEPIVGMVSDVASTGRVYSNDLLLDAQADAEVNIITRKAKKQATEKVLKDEAVLTKLQTQAETALMEDLFD